MGGMFTPFLHYLSYVIVISNVLRQIHTSKENAAVIYKKNKFNTNKYNIKLKSARFLSFGNCEPFFNSKPLFVNKKTRRTYHKRNKETTTTTKTEF